MDETATVDVDGGAKGRAVLALLLVLLAAVLIVPIVTDSGGDEELVPLGLRRGGADADAEGASDAMYPYVKYEYVLRGELPDLGEAGPVYRIVAPTLDAAAAQRMAAGFGIDGTAERVDEGYTVDDGERMFSAWPGPAGWYVSTGMSYDEGSVSGGGSSGSSGGTVAPTEPDCLAPDNGGDLDCGPDTIDPDLADICARIEAGEDVEYVGDEPDCSVIVDPPQACEKIVNEDGSVAEVCTGTDGDGDDPVVDPGEDPIPLPEPIAPIAPEDLPSEAEAEQIARDLLAGAGVLDGEWDVEVFDGGAVGIAYAEACDSDGVCTETEMTEEQYVTSRMVTFTKLLDGHRVDGLTWSVDVGDHGEVASVWGQHAQVEVVADYPLRPIDDAYAQMVAGEDQGWGWGDDIVPMLGDAEAISSRKFEAVGAEIQPVTGCTVQSDGSEICELVDEPVMPPECPEGAECAAPGEAPPPAVCKVQPDGSEICELRDPMPLEPPISPCTIQPDGSEICEYPDDVVIDPMPVEEPEPIVIEITGAELGLMIVPGTAEDGSEVAYIVPSYVFVGEYPDGGGEYRHPTMALAPEWIGGPEATTTSTTVVPTETTYPPSPTTIDEPPASIPTTSVVEPPTTIEPPETTVPAPVDPGPPPTMAPGPDPDPSGEAVQGE